MQNKNTTKTKNFFKSFINNRCLFENRKISIWISLAILLLIICSLTLPSYFSNRSTSASSVMKKYPGIEDSMIEIFTNSLDCVVKDQKLNCSEDSPALNKVAGDRIKYTVIVNQKTIAIDTTVSNTTPKDTDNLIILYSQSIRIRYSQRDEVNQTVSFNELIGDYSNFEGYSLVEIGEKIKNDPDLANKEIENFILKAHQSTLDTRLFVDIVSTLISFLMLLLVSCIIIKGSFRLKKGFKFIDSFKIATSSACSSLIIAFVLSLLVGIYSFGMLFGLIFVGRIIFVYFKFIFTNKIFKELYAEEANERYNI